MATKTLATGDGMTKKVYEEKLFREMSKEIYFEKFMGSIVNVKTALEKGKGDVINFGLGMRLTNRAISGELSAVEGNEEAVVHYSDSVTLDIYSQATKYGAHLSEQRAAFALSSLAKDALKVKVAEEIDKQMFEALDTPDAAVIAYTESGATTLTYHSTAATALAAVGATDTLRVRPLQAIKPFLKTGNSRAMAPIKPVRIKGRDYYVCLQHPNALVDLKQNSEYAQYIREAQVRGDENPIFTGAVAIIDGYVIHEHEEVPLGTGSASASVSKGYILGKDALCWAWGRRPWAVKETFNYGKEVGEAMHWMSGVTAPVFNSKPLGYISYYVGTSADFAGASVS